MCLEISKRLYKALKDIIGEDFSYIDYDGTMDWYVCTEDINVAIDVLKEYERKYAAK